MPIDTYWHDDEKTVLVYNFQGTWTLEEFNVAIDNVVVLLSDHNNGRLDIISDMSAGQMARNINGNAMQAVWNRSYKVLPEDYRLAVVVGAGLMLEFFIKTFGKIYAPIRNHVRAAGTLEEALELIKNDRHKESDAA